MLTGLPLTVGLAKSHALNCKIGNYANPRVDFPRVDSDAASLLHIAQAMDVASTNFREPKVDVLSAAGFARAFSDLRDRMRTGDTVSIDYSGHGTREAEPGTSGAPEG